MRTLLATAVALLVAAPVASAATIPVTTSSDTNVDDGLCALREAVRAANTDAPTLGCPAGGGPDTISVPAGTFRLTLAGSDQAAASGDLDITATVTIRGEGQGVTTVDGNGTNRVFEVRPAVNGVRIERMTVSGGLPNDDDNGDGCRGGGLLSRGDVTVANSIITDNRTGNACSQREGGGIAAISGTLSVLDSVVSNNAAASGKPQPASQCGTSCSGSSGDDGGAGGGVWSAGGVTVARSTFSGNRAGAGGAGGGATGGDGPGGGTGGTGTGGTGGVGGDGGAIASDGGAVVIDDSTISGNRAGDGGAGGAGNGGIGGAGGPGGTGNGGSGGKGGDGGGVNAQGTLSVNRSTLSGNVAGASGRGGTGTGGRGGTGGATTSGPGMGGIGGTAGRAGGIFAVQLTAVNTTLDGNVSGGGGNGGAGAGGSGGFTTPGVGIGGDGRSPGDGGALALLGSDSDDQLVHLTISDNRVGSYGTGGAGTGAAGSRNGAPATLERASGLYSNAPVRFQSTIVTGAVPGCRAVGNALVDGGGNLRTPGSGCPGADGDAGLRALSDNGGPVATRSPAPGGLALDRNGSGCPATDARGFARPFGAACDAGAYELAPPAATTGAATGTTATGSFNLRGPAGSAYFQYGTTTDYGRSTAAVASGSGFDDRSLSAVLSGLPAGATVHYRLVAATPDGTALGADRTLTTPVTAPLAAPKDTTAPRLSSLKLSKKKFKAGTRVVISFTSTEAGAGRLTFERVVRGKKVKGKATRGKKAKTRCVATGRRVKSRQRCKAYKTAGAISAKAKKGKNEIVFRGKLGKKRLARGEYRLSVTVTDGAGNKSRAATTTFKVTRR